LEATALAWKSESFSTIKKDSLPIDGSNLSIPYNPEENNCNEEKQISTMHLDGLFDVMNKIFVDVCCPDKRQEQHRNPVRNETA